REYPPLPWTAHEDALTIAGFYRLAGCLDEAEFEIPAAGLGVFACRKDAWPGFNPLFRGFGGEEHYIHEKVRGNDGRCLCLPSLGWLHRYGNPSGPADQRPKWHLFRNYVLGHAELGMSLGRIRDGMQTMIPEREWSQLISNPYNPPEWPAADPDCCTE